jgi:hypothetical protein
MDLRRLRIGELVAAAGGVLLIVALLVPWFEYDVATSFGPRPELPSQNAFEALAVADVILLLVGLAAIGLALATAAERTVAVPIAYATLLTLVALVGVIVVVAHLGSSPPPAQPVAAELRGSVETSTALGLPLALLGALTVLAGSLLAMRDERLSGPERPTDATGRPVESQPEPERLPAPPPQTAG